MGVGGCFRVSVSIWFNPWLRIPRLNNILSQINENSDYNPTTLDPRGILFVVYTFISVFKRQPNAVKELKSLQPKLSYNWIPQKNAFMFPCFSTGWQYMGSHAGLQSWDQSDSRVTGESQMRDTWPDGWRAPVNDHSFRSYWYQPAGRTTVFKAKETCLSCITYSIR